MKNPATAALQLEPIAYGKLDDAVATLKEVEIVDAREADVVAGIEDDVLELVAHAEGNGDIDFLTGIIEVGRLLYRLSLFTSPTLLWDDIGGRHIVLCIEQHAQLHTSLHAKTICYATAHK